MLGDQAAGQRQPLTDGMDRQGCCLDDAEGGVGQGQHALGMQIGVEQTVQETVHILEARVWLSFIVSPANRDTCGETRCSSAYGNCNVINEKI